MEEITLESLKSLNQEELAAFALTKHQEALTKKQEYEELERVKKEVEKGAVLAATELNALKKQQTPTIDVDAVVEAKLQQREVDTKFNTVVGQLPDDLQDKFKTQFEELAWWRTLTPADADKLIKATLSLVAPDARWSNVWAFAVWGGSPSKVNSVKAQEDEARKEYAKNMLKGII